MLKVFITIDTEMWESSIKEWNDHVLHNLINRDIYGITSRGEFGLRHLIQMFSRYKLKANFFVETLFTCIAGLDPLKRIVSLISESGNDVQLHLHPDWFRFPENSLAVCDGKYAMNSFSQEDQTNLIKQGINLLKAANVNNVVAFRAGDYAANLDTIKALHNNCIFIDSSYNYAYLKNKCKFNFPEKLYQPQPINNVYEFPISCFIDFMGHHRHLQLNACSIYEFKSQLRKACEARYFSVVIVLHTFELIGRRADLSNSFADWILIQRFEQLCEYLADNRDKYETALFSEIDLSEIPRRNNLQVNKSDIFHTSFRYYQQVRRRISRLGNPPDWVENIDVGSFRKEHKRNYKIINDVLSKNAVSLSDDSSVRYDRLKSAFEELIRIPNLLTLLDKEQGLMNAQAGTIDTEVMLSNKKKLFELYSITLRKEKRRTLVL